MLLLRTRESFSGNKATSSFSLEGLELADLFHAEQAKQLLEYLDIRYISHSLYRVH